MRTPPQTPINPLQKAKIERINNESDVSRDSKSFPVYRPTNNSYSVILSQEVGIQNQRLDAIVNLKDDIEGIKHLRIDCFNSRWRYSFESVFAEDK